jgi:hypothetical protein
MRRSSDGFGERGLGGVMADLEEEEEGWYGGLG